MLMGAFAGANTVVRGNCTFGMFSNYPEKVDDALRQRAGAASWSTARRPARTTSTSSSCSPARTTGSRSATTSSMPRRRSSAPSREAYEATPAARGGAREVYESSEEKGAPKTMAEVGTYLH